MIKLYRANRIWKIWYNKDLGLLFYGGGLLHGAPVIHSKVIQPKANRTYAEQIELETKSRVSKQLDKGYAYEAGKPDTNQLGLARPMLALPIEKAKNISLKNAVMQFKLDGTRCLLHGLATETVAYSRQGKLLNIPHITEPLHLPEGVTIDGELYCHGETLQTICSWVKRYQLNTSKLKFMAYDYISSDRYLERYSKLQDIVANGPTSVEILANMPYTTEAHLTQYFNTARAAGYEGLIVRLDGYGYITGKRPKALLKVKQWLDANFIVYDIVPSSDGLAVLDCKSFRVVAPGTHAMRLDVLKRKEEFIGKTVEVQYACLTADGIPFHPVALRWL